MKFFSLFVSLFIQLQAHGYIIVSDTQLKPNVATDVFIAGFGDEQKSQFLYVASLAYQVAKDRFPQRQRILMSAVNGPKNLEFLKSQGFQVLKYDETEFSVENAFAQLKKINRISSMQYFGHNNPSTGFRFQSKENRLWPNDERLKQFKGQFMKNSFVALHGCNTAWLLAPAIAKLLNVTVFASFGSADFQNYYENNQWYYHDTGRFPEGMYVDRYPKNITSNKLDCVGSWCMRLKPTHLMYNGAAGKFDAGLDFMRGFNSQTSLKDYSASLLHFVYLWPSEKLIHPGVTFLELSNNFAEMMCPSDRSSIQYAQCKKLIIETPNLIQPTTSFFDGTAVACPNEACNYQVICKKRLFGKPCETKKITNDVSVEWSRQVQYFLQNQNQLVNVIEELNLL